MNLTDVDDKTIRDSQKARLAKDCATADALKQQLLGQGIEVKDTPTGPVWKIIKK